jgi:hypothetical protein
MVDSSSSSASPAAPFDDIDVDIDVSTSSCDDDPSSCDDTSSVAALVAAPTSASASAMRFGRAVSVRVATIDLAHAAVFVGAPQRTSHELLDALYKWYAEMREQERGEAGRGGVQAGRGGAVGRGWLFVRVCVFVVCVRRILIY